MSSASRTCTQNEKRHGQRGSAPVCFFYKNKKKRCVQNPSGCLLGDSVQPSRACQTPYRGGDFSGNHRGDGERCDETIWKISRRRRFPKLRVCTVSSKDAVGRPVLWKKCTSNKNCDRVTLKNLKKKLCHFRSNCLAFLETLEKITQRSVSCGRRLRRRHAVTRRTRPHPGQGGGLPLEPGFLILSIFFLKESYICRLCTDGFACINAVASGATRCGGS